ncbi:2560_t:CDS:2, partial [Funneliformis caledonium]
LKISFIHLDFQNIRERGLWKQHKVRKQGLSNILSAENLLINITKIYQDVYKNFETNVYINITLRVSEAIDIEDADS